MLALFVIYPIINGANNNFINPITITITITITIITTTTTITTSQFGNSIYFYTYC